MPMTKPEKNTLVRDVKQRLRTLSAFVGVSGKPQPERYPCERVKVYFNLGLDWPIGIDDSCQIASLSTGLPEGLVLWPPPNIDRSGVEERIVPVKEATDARVRALLGALVETWHESEVVAAMTFPPMGFSSEEDKEALKYWREMTPKEEATFIEVVGRKPFSDEYWIPVRYAGINYFGSFEARSEA